LITYIQANPTVVETIKTETSKNIDQLTVTSISYLSETNSNGLPLIKGSVQSTGGFNNKFKTEAELSKNDKELLQNQPKVKLKNSSETQTQNTNQKCNSLDCLSDKVELATSIDVSQMIKSNPVEENKKKEEQNKEKQKVLDRLTKSKTNPEKYQNGETKKHQFNEMEAEMYKKEGIDVEEYNADIIDKNGKVKPKAKKTVDVTDIINKALSTSLSLGSLKTEAKGLNNSANSLIMYNINSTNLSWTVRGEAGNQVYLDNNYGNYNWYYAQRWCFSNDTNQIYLTFNVTCDYLTSSFLCLDAFGGHARMSRIGLWGCHSGANQKWIFDEMGRVAPLTRQDLCVDGENYSWGQGARMILWDCHNGSNQTFRAGYNNHGTGMGMSIWATGVGNVSGFTLFDGHAYIETWNNYGTHNTFSRWGNPTNYVDSDCGNSWYWDSLANQWKTARLNNICDGDQISVDHPFEINFFRPNYTIGTSGYKGTWSYMNKSNWDYLVFGSGYRSNWYQNARLYNNMDLGGQGTYTWYGSSCSRDVNCQAIWYAYANMCSTYSLKIWKNFRDNGSYSGLDYVPTFPSDIYDRI
jgi:hypothetical protein